MTRPKARGLIQTGSFDKQVRDHLMPVSARRKDAPEPPKKWYNIVNKKTESADSVDEADVMIYSEIGDSWWGDSVSASDFAKELADLDVSQINVHINSPGGDVFDGVAIYNAIKMHPANVTVYVDSLAASAASFIAQAGDKVVMLRGSTMMIHDASGLAWGNEEVMRDSADLLGKISNNIADIYAQRAGGTRDSWREVMKAEQWYLADEAVEAGLADEVLDKKNEDAEAKAKATWDLSVFNYAGRSEAPSPAEQMHRIITNRAKEAPVAKQTTTPRNEGENENPPATEAPAAPAPESAPDTQPDGENTEEQTQQTNGDNDVQPPNGPSTTGAPEPTASNKNGVVTFVVNGAQVSDISAVQRHINSLEQFARETKDSNRKSFIEALAKDGKIAASQIPQMEKLVASFTSDEQYDLWAASWDAAPKNGLFENHGKPDNGGQAQPTADADDRIETLKGIVDQHKRSGMKPEAIEKTPSYNELKKLQPEFTL